MSINQITPELLQEYVEKGLKQLRDGDFFVHGLDSTDTIIESHAYVPDKKEKRHPFIKFLNAIAGEMSKDFQIQGTNKIFQKLFALSQQWVDMIAPKETKPDKPKQKSLKKQTTQKTKEKKKKAIEVVEKKGSKEQENTNDEDDEELLDYDNLDIDGKRKLFEEGRDYVLNELPEEYKKRFGEVVFARWSNTLILPALIRNPYSVPPGKARDDWHKMHDNVKGQQGRKHTFLVYWYGSSDDPGSQYTILPGKSIYDYDTGVKKGYDKVPKKIQLKLDSGKALTKTETGHVEGLIEQKEDLSKEPLERQGYLGAFVESYLLPSDVEEEEETPKKIVKKISKKKKRKKIDDQQEESTSTLQQGPSKKLKKKKGKKSNDVSQFFEEPTQTKEKPKPIKKTKKITKTTSIQAFSESDTEAKDKDKDISESSEKSHVEKPPDIKDPEQAAKDEFEFKYALGEIDSDGKASSESSDEDFDDSFETSAVSNTKRSLSSGTSTSKVQPKKKQLKTKQKITKARKAGKGLKSEEDIMRKEQRDFAISEKTFQPMLARWKKALNSQDQQAIGKSITSVQEIVEKIHFCLMPDVHQLMKETKAVLSDDRKEDLKLLKSALREQFSLKKKSHPMAFEPIRKYKSVNLRSPFTTSTPAATVTPVAGIIGSSKQHESSMSLASQDSSKTSMKQSLKHISSLEKINENSSDAQTITVASQPKETRTERKKFSLGNLMRPGNDSQKRTTSTSAVDKGLSSTSGVKQSQALPDWITGVLKFPNPTVERRAIGFDFLRQAAPFIQGKGVNHECIAHALEDAIEKFSSGDASTYWITIDNIIAAISGGRQKVGTISLMIAKGEFKTASEVVNLDMAKILDSFEGKPILLL